MEVKELYAVRISYQGDTGYRDNRIYHVVAGGMDQVLLEANSWGLKGMTVWSINHLGKFAMPTKYKPREL